MTRLQLTFFFFLVEFFICGFSKQSVYTVYVLMIWVVGKLQL